MSRTELSPAASSPDRNRINSEPVILFSELESSLSAFQQFLYHFHHGGRVDGATQIGRYGRAFGAAFHRRNVVHGRNAKIPDWLGKISGDCPKRQAASKDHRMADMRPVALHDARGGRIDCFAL